jgi:hypothetical protein
MEFASTPSSAVADVAAVISNRAAETLNKVFTPIMNFLL